MEVTNNQTLPTSMVIYPAVGSRGFYRFSDRHTKLRSLSTALESRVSVKLPSLPIGEYQ